MSEGFIILNDNFRIRYTLIFLIIYSIFVFIILLFKKNSVQLTDSKKVFRNVCLVIATYLFFPLFYWWVYSNISSNNFLMSLCNIVQQYDFIIFFILLSLTIYSSLVYKNFHSYITAIIPLIIAAIYIEIISEIILRKIDLLDKFNILIFIFIGLYIIILKSLKFKKLDSNKYSNDYNSFSPNYRAIEEYDKLYESRKWQANDLISLINSENDSPISICVSGEWGSGKTSFVNSVLNVIENNYKDKFSVICINLIDVDNLESLLEHFFSKIKMLLIDEGNYVGVSSDYKRYLSNIIEIVSNSRIKSNLLKDFFYNDKSYRKSKDELENALYEMLGEKKLIIVIDDIERCDSENIPKFINFLKEIVSINNSRVIFITDYVLLEESINKPKGYLDKYFNYRYHLVNVDLKEIIMSSFKQESNPFIIIEEFRNFSILDEISSILTYLEDEVNKIKKINESLDKKQSENNELSEKYNLTIYKIEECKKLIIKKIQNPRNVNKFMAEISKVFIIVRNELSVSKNINLDDKIAYLNKINIYKTIINYSFIKSSMEKEYENIKNNGLKEYIKILSNDISKYDIDQILTYYLFKDWCFNDAFNFLSFSYSSDEIFDFIDCLISKPEEIKNIINIFTSETQKSIAELRNDKNIFSFDNLKLKLHHVVANYNYSNISEGQKLIEKIFIKTQNLLDKKEIQFEQIFDYLQYENISIRDLNPNLRLLELFHNTFCINIKNTNFSTTIIEKSLFLFERNYSEMSIENFYTIFYYYAEFHNLNMDDILADISSNNLNTISVKDKLVGCLNAVSYDTPINENNYLKEVKIFINRLNQKLEKIQFNKIPDIKNDIETALSQIEEYEYLDKIKKCIKLNLDVNYKKFENIDITNDDEIKLWIENEIYNYLNIFQANYIDINDNSRINDFEQFLNKIIQISNKKKLPQELINEINVFITQVCDKYDKRYLKRFRLKAMKIALNKE